MTDAEQVGDRCPHCNHKYWRNTFKECPNCHRHWDDAPGAVPREGPKAVAAAQQAAAAKFDSLPPDVRQETLLRRIADDQAAAAASVRSIRTGVWLLVAWFIVLPVLTAIWFMLRS
jgi:hypothetical protein